MILVLEVGRRYMSFPSRGRLPPGATNITVSRGRHFVSCAASSGTMDAPIEWPAEPLTNRRLDPRELRRRLSARKSNPRPTFKLVLQSLCICIRLATSKKSIGGLSSSWTTVSAPPLENDEVPGS